ncbi:MAG TPA: rod shape-determining protein MreC [Steroidobacter sp.]
MVTLSSDSRPILGRGPPLGAGLFFLGLLSVALMVLDHRGGYLDTARLWLGSAVRPIYAVVQAPYDLWNWLTASFADRTKLRAENERLTEELRLARIKLLRFEALNEENRRLRAIREASRGVGERTLIAEIMSVAVHPFRHLVRINKGADDGVFRGQPVLDAFGIVGQVMQLDKTTATVILITDSEHAIPVQVNRNGIRSIAVGTGDMGKLNLPYMTIDSDVQPGDLLVSSGLDGIFPAGYPVATVSRVERDPNATFALVEAKPLAHLDRDREVLLLWVDQPQSRPEEPAEAPDRNATQAAQKTEPPQRPDDRNTVDDDGAAAASQRSPRAEAQARE